MRRRGLLAGAMAGLAALLTAAAPPHEKDWSATVTVTSEGYHLRGNPQAPFKLVEYVSYSCPHCGVFEMQGGEELTERFIKPGSVSYEVRPFFLNEIDKTATLIAYCGPPARFFANHTQLLKFQHEWLRNPTQAQIERWSNPAWNTRVRAMTEDLGLYAMMAKLGHSRSAIDKCLADEPTVARLQQATEEAFYKQGVQGTPAFFLNGERIPETVWPVLRQRLAAAMKEFV